LGLLLVDSDQFLLLSVSGLLEDLAGAVGRELRRLDPLPSQIKRANWCKDRFDETQRHVALEMASKVKSVKERADDDLFQKLVKVEEIDEGEALLFAHAASDPQCLVTTGDLRALQALSVDPSLSEVRGLLARKVLPLEVCVKLLLDRFGHHRVAEALGAVRNCNKTLGVIFSGHNCRNETDCRQAVHSCLRDLARKLDSGILYPCG
jgi:hypothetical protein